MQTCIYLPTGKQAIVLREIDELHYLIFTDNKQMTVSKNDVAFSEDKVACFREFRQALFARLLNGSYADILYSLHSGRLTPEPHQYKPLLKFIHSPNNRLLIADEVGLGKTIEAGMIYTELSKRETLCVSIVVAPPSLLHKWRDELLIRFGVGFEIYDGNQFLSFLRDYDRHRDNVSYDKKIIISYNSIRSEAIIDALRNSFLNVDFLAMDEAHTFRNSSTNTRRGVEELTKKARSVVFLSATPVQNDIKDLFNILSLLDCDYFRDFDAFKKSIEPNAILHKLTAMLKNRSELEDIKAYIERCGYEHIASYSQKEIIGKLRLLGELTQQDRAYFIRELSESDHLSFIVNRTKKRDIGRLIPRKAVSKSIEPTLEEKAYYDEVVEFVKLMFEIERPTASMGFITIMPERMASSSMQASVDSFKHMRQTKKLVVRDFEEDDEYESEEKDQELRGEALKRLDTVIAKGELIGDMDTKLKELESVIRGLEESGIRKMIIFSFFKRTIDYLHAKLCELGLKASKMHGANSPDERYEIVDKFRRGEFDILISSEVGSEGLDMQFCSVVINYDMPWNPMRVEQRIGRIDRIGQKAESLSIFNLCLKGSIEDRIYQRLYSKLRIFEESIGELEPILGDMTNRLDLKKILTMSEEESKRLLDERERAIKTSAEELKLQSDKIDSLLNNDYCGIREEEYLDKAKESFFRDECRALILKFFNDKGVIHTVETSSALKVSDRDIIKLASSLGQSLPPQNDRSYVKERDFTNKLARERIGKFTFFDSSFDMNTENISLSHPIVSMLTRKISSEVALKTVVRHGSKNGGYMFLYSFNVNGYKKDKRLVGFMDDGSVDKAPLALIASCEEAEDNGSFGIDATYAEPFMISYKNLLAKEEQDKNDRYVDGAISSIVAYYNKKKATAEARANNEDEGIARMGRAELENLTQELWDRIDDLNGNREISISSEFVGVLKFV